MSIQPEIRAAAVVFRIDEHERRALADFARELGDAGCSIGGMVQEAFFDDQGRRTRIDSVDLATGDHVMINQPSRNWPDGKECTLDTAALADASAPLRRGRHRSGPADPGAGARAGCCPLAGSDRGRDCGVALRGSRVAALVAREVVSIRG